MQSSPLVIDDLSKTLLSPIPRRSSSYRAVQRYSRCKDKQDIETSITDGNVLVVSLNRGTLMWHSGGTEYQWYSAIGMVETTQVVSETNKTKQKLIKAETENQTQDLNRCPNKEETRFAASSTHDTNLSYHIR